MKNKNKSCKQAKQSAKKKLNPNKKKQKRNA